LLVEERPTVRGDSSTNRVVICLGRKLRHNLSRSFGDRADRQLQIRRGRRVRAHHVLLVSAPIRRMADRLLFSAETESGSTFSWCPHPQLTGDNNMMSGFAWLPDSTGIVYSSSRGRTIPYSPTLGLWQVTLRDGSVRRVTSGETSYMSPDISRSGSIWVGRMKLQTDIWKFKPSLPKRERS
jgi:hypothetical protein